MTIMRILTLCLTFTGLVLTGFSSPVSAQNLFSPAVKINEQAVTHYEVQQRARFMTLLRAPGNAQELALESLVDERLQIAAAASVGITPTEEEVLAGMEEFAGRANMTAEQFVKALASGGVAAETFRDFVKAGMSWRSLVRARFSARAQVSEDEIDRAIAQSSGQGGLRVLLSEIILPANTPQATAASQRQAEKISQVTTLAAFSANARRYSASPSAAQGGRLQWMPLSNLPAPIRGQILALSPGQVTGPIPITNGIVLFQLRAIEETDVTTPTDLSVEYAQYFIAGGHSDAAMKEAARVRAKVDNCDDLYGINKGKPEDLLLVDTLPVSQVPQDIALELAKLDPGEVSTRLTRNNGQTLVFLMMCGRTPELGEDVSRDTIRAQLVNQRLQSYADGYLSELRADATIVYP